VHLIIGNVLQRRTDRALRQLGGQYPPEAGRQGQGEVAIAAVQFQQIVVVATGSRQRPAQHMLVDAAIGLGETPFHLLIAPGAAVHLQLFDNVITLQHPPPTATAADQQDTQLIRQPAGSGVPLLVDGAVVAQGYQRLAGQGGQELHLEQPVAQFRVGLAGFQQRHHQVVDPAAGDGQLIDQDRLAVAAGFEHGVVRLTVLVPQAKLSPQAEVLNRRGKHLGRGGVEGLQQLDQALALGLQLLIVTRRIKRHCHQLKNPSLTMNSADSTYRLALRPRQRPGSSLIAVQVIKPRAMPLAMEEARGITSTVTTTGAAAVRSPQTTWTSPLVISTATKNSAGAVANAGTAPASGDRNRLSRNSAATTQAVRPVRPPTAVPAADST